MLTHEYEAARNQAAVFDVSDRGKVELTGKDAAKFLHNLSTNDFLTLAVGESREAFFCTAKAKVIAHALVHRLPSSFWLDTDPGCGPILAKHLDYYLISEQVEITDRSSEMAQLRLVGPEAETVVARTPSEGQVFRQAALALPGCDLVVPRERGEALRQALIHAGAVPAHAEAMEVLRVEAGWPAYGKEFDENRFVVEVHRTAQAICYTKGCYLGQEPIVMARDRGHVNRFLVGLRLSADGVAPTGAKVFHDGREVGQVTSSVISPRLGPIALAYVWRGSEAPGTAVEVEAAGGRRSATVAGLPFGA